ncbi:MAG TPA: DUF397 domain-containing protein [Streptosporangiaceae bacterium]|nr:DUF397 domain-containing protein [Streptosporangiaceae bacterium]
MKADLTRATWRKSSFSGAAQDCVEIGDLPGAVGVRDSKDPGGPALVFAPDAWRTFVTGIKGGEFGRA